MTRYTGWRRLSGDTADRPDLLDFGKKLLGYLDGQRQLSGVKTLSIERTLPDGSVVRARFDYDIPVIEVLAANPAAGAGPDTFLSGLVAEPRTFANYTAFGAKAETLLVPFNTGTPDEKWASYFFDSTYGTGGQYQKTPQGKPLFTDGLTLGGNLDWRSKDESLTVNWFGPASRYFPENGGFGQWVFRNGEVIFDAGNLPQFDTNIRTLVLSAAIRKPGTLLVCTYEKVFTGGGNHHYIRFYRAKLKPSALHDQWFKATGLPTYQAPRLEPVDTAGMLLLDDPDLADDTPVVRIAETEVTELTDYLYVTPFHFNQSATQARCIIPLYQVGPPIASDVTEFVVDLTDLDAVTIDRLSHGVLSDTTTTTHVYTDVTYNRLWGVNFAWRETPPGWPGPPIDGTYPYDDPVRYGSFPPFAPTNPNTLGVGVPKTTSSTVAESCTLSEYLIAVDFKDDVPVYAYMKPRDLTSTSSRTGSVDWTTSGSGSATDVATSSGRILTTTWTCSKDEAANASATSGGGITGTMPGLRCADDTGDWLVFQGSQTGTASKTTSSTYSASGSDSDVRVQDSIAGTDTGRPPGNNVSLTGTVTFDEASDWDNTTVVYKLWFLDLRYQAAAYTRYTNIRSESRSASLSDVWPLTATGISTSIDHDTTHHFQTHVVFNGAEVASWDCDTPTASTTTAGTATFGSVLSPFWIWCGVDSLFSRDYGDTGILRWSVGEPTSGAKTAEGTFEATMPSLSDWSGAITPTQVAAFPMPVTDAYPDDVVVVSAVTDDGWDNFWFDGSDSLANATGASWLTDLTLSYGGRYQAYRGGWCYSMPKLVGTSTSSALYDTRISSGESVDTLTGSHGLDLLGALWPLSRCPFITSKG